MEIYELTVHELLEKLDKKEITKEEILASYQNRINEKEKDVQAFVTKTCEEAKEKLKEVASNTSKLAGIPIGIKDNICTKGVKTTCSSKMLENFVAPYDATVMEKINEEGMVSLGKLNMDEFAMGGSTEHSYFKKTRNPWNLNKVPGGSSGGSAAAVASRNGALGIRIRHRRKYTSTSIFLWNCWIKTDIWISFSLWTSSICIISRSNRYINKRCRRCEPSIKCNCRS